jgi:hypothetical protein
MVTGKLPLCIASPSVPSDAPMLFYSEPSSCRLPHLRVGPGCGGAIRRTLTPLCPPFVAIVAVGSEAHQGCAGIRETHLRRSMSSWSNRCRRCCWSRIGFGASKGKRALRGGLHQTRSMRVVEEALRLHWCSGLVDGVVGWCERVLSGTSHRTSAPTTRAPARATRNQ